MRELSYDLWGFGFIRILSVLLSRYTSRTRMFIAESACVSSFPNEARSRAGTCVHVEECWKRASIAFEPAAALVASFSGRKRPGHEATALADVSGEVPTHCS